ncbi:hypothetical protein B0919_16590 [Hymenobacter sp. CRA2]|nr:hypothetical protein B0919_16590 [Hymenobacter sp. CRA2]
MLAYLNSLLAPLASLYQVFIEFQATVRRELSYNGQTLAFQRALNDRFDPVLARIRIINSDAVSVPVYINFVREPESPKNIKSAREAGPHLVLNSVAEEASLIGFVVRCPATLSGQEPALKARIDQLKLALVKYRIQYV